MIAYNIAQRLIIQLQSLGKHIILDSLMKNILKGRLETMLEQTGHGDGVKNFLNLVMKMVLL